MTMVQSQLLEVLEKTASQNPNDQTLALDYLKRACLSNFPEFIKQLSAVLATITCSNFIRQAAGIQLKNVLFAKEETTRNEYLNRWLALPESVRLPVKENVLRTLGTEPFRPSIVAQCVAAIACAEIPSQQWPDVIAILQRNVTSSGNTENLKESCLEALGYICQDINSVALEAQSNEILTAIVHGLRKEETSNHVRLAAANALLNSLEFTRNNFVNKTERDVIMQVVCEASQCPDIGVKVVAMQCLVKIVSLYYQFMEQYMKQALFPISLGAMQSDEDAVALQGIEFWSNVCEEEIALNAEAEEAQELGKTPENISRHYSKGALSHIIPYLTATLAKQGDADEDDWTPSKAAGVCIMFLAQCTGDFIVRHTWPFIEGNLRNSDWRFREASIMAFGSILDGPSSTLVLEIVESAISLLIESLDDAELQVRDTAAWCMGRICDTCEEIATREEILKPLLPALFRTLQQGPRVAANVCWTISSLVKAAYIVASNAGTDNSGQPETFILSSCFQAMVDELIRVIDRPDAHIANLRIAAFETLMELIKNSPKDCYPTVQKTTLYILERLEVLLNAENTLDSSTDKSQLRDLQSLLCATLQSVLRKVRPEDAPLIGGTIMNGLLQIMHRCPGKNHGVVMEDALLAVSTLIEALGMGFMGFIDAFQPYLIEGLSNHEESQVCIAAVGVLADLCRAFENNIVPYLGGYMKALFEIILSEKANCSVKPAVLSCIGDIALAIGPKFIDYYTHVMAILKLAVSSAKISNENDYDVVDYVEKLRESCIEAYTGILQGMQPSKLEVPTLADDISSMLELINLISMSAYSDSLLAMTAGFIGDLVTSFGKDILPAFENDNITAMLSRGKRSKTTKAKTLSSWAIKEIKLLKNQVN